jgi:hypothetical protein
VREEEAGVWAPQNRAMARLFLALVLTGTLLSPSLADAAGSSANKSELARPTHRQPSGAAAGGKSVALQSTTDPVALSLKLAERFWHGAPPCGTPTVLISPHQLPNSDYETVTSPEPKNSIVEMWTEVQTCTIIINASVWRSWQEDDESFQWFCDAMTHEVGHLFGHPDSGQTDASSITFPYLAATSPNFNSVPECKNITLSYGSETMRG